MVVGSPVRYTHCGPVSRCRAIITKMPGPGEPCTIGTYTFMRREHGLALCVYKRFGVLRTRAYSFNESMYMTPTWGRFWLRKKKEKGDVPVST